MLLSCVRGALVAGSGTAPGSLAALQGNIWALYSRLQGLHGSAGSWKDPKAQWESLIWASSVSVNPCNSKYHPAVALGVLERREEEPELPVQQAYTPESRCFGCGPANPEGLHLKSTRIQNGLEASATIPDKFCAFPGIVNGGMLATLLDCHANWTAAISLMDKACLPRPPFTLTASMLLTYKEPTPPDAPLVLRSKVVSIKESAQPGVGKASVEVETRLYLRTSELGSEDGEGLKLLVIGQSLHKRMGALRAL